MRKQNSQQPTEAELEILAVLWSRGQSTVREIHEDINTRRPTAYTTTLKMLQIMDDKGLVERDKTNRAHVYQHLIEREATERGFAQGLLQTVFRGSVSQLIIRVLESEPSDVEELAAIRRVIDEAERNARK